MKRTTAYKLCILMALAMPIIALNFDPTLSPFEFGLQGDVDDLPIDDQCEDNDDCSDLYNCIQGQCIHKELFPLTFREIVSTILIMVISGFANSGGLGGGALMSPILLIGYNYSATKAIQIVFSLVFGGALGNFLNVANQKDKKGRPLVDYDLSMICMPTMLMGAQIGVLLNRAAPSLVIIVGLVVLMIFVIKKLYKKAKVEYEKETEALKKPLLSTHHEDIPLQELTKDGEINEKVVETPDYNPEFVAKLEEEKMQFPPSKLKPILFLVLFLVFMGLVRGSAKFHSILGVGFCGPIYWVLYCSSFAGCYYFYQRNKTIVYDLTEQKKMYGFFSEDEFSLKPQDVGKMANLSLVAGILAGLLGIGGGMVMGPTLITFGIGAQQLGATAGFFVVQTSFVALFLSIFSGGVTFVEVMFFMGSSLIGSFGVSKTISFFVKKYNRPSIVLISLVGVIGVSLIVMPIFGVYKSLENPEEMLSFGNVC